MLDRISMGGVVEPEQQLEKWQDAPWPDDNIAVSYTHLTLPTKA